MLVYETLKPHNPKTMNKEEFLSLLTEKFSAMDAAHLETLAASLAAQQPDAHQGQALVNKLTAEQVADYLAATTPSVAGDTPSAADSLDKRIEESVRKAVLAFEQRLSLFETQQKQQLQHNRLQEVLAQCQDSNFRMQSLRDFPLMHFATPADFEQYLQQKKNDVQQANQTLANRSLALQHPPFYTKETPRQNVSPAVVSFIQLQANAQQQFKGKQV